MTFDEQVGYIVDRVTDMLDGDDEQVTLTVSKGFIYLAAYMARLRHKPGEIVESWENDSQQAEAVLSDILHKAMHEELHNLAQHDTWLCRKKR